MEFLKCLSKMFNEVLNMPLGDNNGEQKTNKQEIGSQRSFQPLLAITFSQLDPQAYSVPCQIYKMERFAKKVNCFLSILPEKEVFWCFQGIQNDSRSIFFQKTPSQIFDRVLNTLLRSFRLSKYGKCTRSSQRLTECQVGKCKYIVRILFKLCSIVRN